MHCGLKTCRRLWYFWALNKHQKDQKPVFHKRPQNWLLLMDVDRQFSVAARTKGKWRYSKTLTVLLLPELRSFRNDNHGHFMPFKAIGNAENSPGRSLIESWLDYRNVEHPRKNDWYPGKSIWVLVCVCVCVCMCVCVCVCVEGGGGGDWLLFFKILQ